MMSPVVHFIPDLLTTAHDAVEVLRVRHELLNAICDSNGGDDPQYEHAHIKHVFALITREQRPEGIEDVVRIDEVVREDPEVDSDMENDEPDNSSHDGHANEENESVPGDIPHALLKPVRPDSEEEEEEDEADEEYKLQLDAEASARGLNLENVESRSIRILVLLRQQFDDLRLFSRWIVRIRVLLTEGNNSRHRSHS